MLLPLQRLWTNGSLGRNKELVERLQLYGIIKSKKVAEVMEAIDRGLFVPPGSAPYVDTPILIGYNATISAPHMHAACLELLREHLQPGMRALDVGSGPSISALSVSFILCFLIFWLKGPNCGFSYFLLNFIHKELECHVHRHDMIHVHLHSRFYKVGHDTN
ncbi:hypothetical protein BHE74_00056541 [Ensete ventricosum]|uniref:Uncharacterized protein n=1 Tax=Ensete ventricosum TaxID=4639 RepID=A0A444C1N9_ENSVE|nr:hypothetical protein B296_00055594 [Ensete ventricosum]RWV79761.1 hypothetical protein GW17_00059056 [Ensete ventricosum]RWW38239.1 hypothetical protein BHE74_00056541 [Ensete ventricosum]RZS27278.1 hypothetical protein BHM03_00060723 [Ensete ventricosum]